MPRTAPEAVTPPQTPLARVRSPASPAASDPLDRRSSLALRSAPAAMPAPTDRTAPPRSECEGRDSLVALRSGRKGPAAPCGQACRSVSTAVPPSSQSQPVSCTPANSPADAHVTAHSISLARPAAHTLPDASRLAHPPALSPPPAALLCA